MAFRRGKHLATVVAMAATAAAVWSMGGEMLFDPWPPHVTLLPFAALLVAGRGLAAIPVLAVSGSFVLQTHTGYVLTWRFLAERAGRGHQGHRGHGGHGGHRTRRAGARAALGGDRRAGRARVLGAAPLEPGGAAATLLSLLDLLGQADEALDGDLSTDDLVCYYELQAIPEDAAVSAWLEELD